LQAQPFRGNARQPSLALQAALKGRTAGGYNPADAKRAAYLTKGARPARKPRPQRPARPPR
jgi:hypothetical protein